MPAVILALAVVFGSINPNFWSVTNMANVSRQMSILALLSLGQTFAILSGGIDVGGKIEVYRLMGELLSRGAAIVMISSELPEILGLSDRILVLRDGRICGEFDRADATEENILNCALRGAPAA